VAFIDLVPQGWLRTYCDTMIQWKHEMPIAMHYLSAVVAVGQLIGFKAYAQENNGSIVYPNINGMLLSPPGECRRGGGTSIAMEVARQAGASVFEAIKLTPEGLLDELRQKRNLLLYIEELSTVVNKRDYQQNMIPILTAMLYGKPGMKMERNRTAGRKWELVDPNLSALLTSAPDWFKSTMPEEAFGGGFMSRFIVCYVERRDVVHLDLDASKAMENKRIIEDLARQLHATVIDGFEGAVELTDDAKVWMRKWYYEQRQKRLVDPNLQAHRNRFHSNLLRMSMIMGACSGKHILDIDILEGAERILSWYEGTMTKLFGYVDTLVNVMGGGAQRIVNTLRCADTHTMEHRDMSRGCLSYFKAGGTASMKHCLQGLVEQGIVVPLPPSEMAVTNGQYAAAVFKKGGWPPHGWRLADTAGLEVE